MKVESPLESITVKPLADYPALYMTWEKQIHVQDVKVAFRTITARLQESKEPLYIIVDLSNQPRIPIVDTMVEALRGPFRNEKLTEWLVIGTTRDARWIADLLTKAAGRSNIQWFDANEDVFTYLEGEKTF
jgi:hypothetical protein